MTWVPKLSSQYGIIRTFRGTKISKSYPTPTWSKIDQSWIRAHPWKALDYHMPVYFWQLDNKFFCIKSGKAFQHHEYVSILSIYCIKTVYIAYLLNVLYRVYGTHRMDHIYIYDNPYHDTLRETWGDRLTVHTNTATLLTKPWERSEETDRLPRIRNSKISALIEQKHISQYSYSTEFPRIISTLFQEIPGNQIQPWIKSPPPGFLHV